MGSALRGGFNAFSLVSPPHSLSTCAALLATADGPEPEYKPDSEYPPWVFGLLDEKPLLEDFIMRGMEKVPTDKMKTVFRMANKRRVKASNASMKKEK